MSPSFDPPRRHAPPVRPDVPGTWPETWPEDRWISACTDELRGLLPHWSSSALSSRASVLWLLANRLPPEEAAELAASWWTA